MSKKPVTEMLKSDLLQAGYRTASQQLTKSFRQFLLSSLKQEGLKKSQVKIIENLLSSEYGASLLSFGVGAIINSIPQLKNNPIANNLATEFRIEGLSQGMTQLVSSLAKKVKSQPATYLLPPKLNTNKVLNLNSTNSSKKPDR